MYTKQQASQLRQEFWTTFGQYMSPVLSAEGRKINWVNYKTGVPHVAFKMDADNQSASISIILSHPDIKMQQLFFEQLLQLKNVLHQALREDWAWQPVFKDEYGKAITRIYTQIYNVNIFNKEYWAKLISFFKSRIVALDKFWGLARFKF